jgi:hypothetical protein
MKSFLVLMAMALLALVPAAWADGPDDQYVAVYSLIQQGDALNEGGHPAAAIAKYTEAQNALKRFQASYPDSYVKVVKFRLNYLATKITQLSAQVPPTAPPAIPAPAPSATAPATNILSAAPPVNPVSPQPAPAPANPELENQLKNLQEQVRRLESDRSLLEAKLKEALAARPAAVDPQELARAQAQITSLEKENELLKATLTTTKNDTLAVQSASTNLEKTRAELAEANRKVAALSEANAALALEKEALQSRMRTLSTPDAATAALREENDLLKKQLTELKTKPAPASPAEATNQKLKEAQAQLAALQSDKEIMRLERIALESKIKQMSSTSAAVPAFAPQAPAPMADTNVSAPSAPSSAEMMDSVTASKIAQLEAQRDELKKNLEAVTRDLKGRKKGRELAARMDEMTRQLASLRARIEVYEAPKAPYTEAELALLAHPDTTLLAAAHVSAKKAIKELPPSAAVKLAEGKRYFVARELDKAEATYLEVLKLDEKNFATLADLASVQLEEHHYPEAEKNIKAAIALEPNDDYSLFVLGQLKFQQKDYNEAFDALSRAAQINPEKAEIQNYLGMTLSEKGLRGPAEAAFRKAIQLAPGYADAHNNLAFVYATQQPPLIELARWHYQKALAAGLPRNPDLEKLLDPNRSTASSTR